MKRGKLRDEIEPIRSGRPIGERNPSGKIYEVDPEAVARLKILMAEKESAQGEQPERQKGDILGNLRSTQRERQAEINARKRKPQIPARLARQWHVTYYQAGLSLKEVAGRAGVGRNLLRRRFKELGLPVSPKLRERVWWPEQDGDRG